MRDGDVAEDADEALQDVDAGEDEERRRQPPLPRGAVPPGVLRRAQGIQPHLPVRRHEGNDDGNAEAVRADGGYGADGPLSPQHVRNERVPLRGRVMGEECEKEMEQQMPMRHCMMWMQGKMRSADANPRFREEHLQECCGEIKEFSPTCRCDAMKEMMMDMQKYGQMEEMERMVRSLPSKCGLSDCHFRRGSA